MSQGKVPRCADCAEPSKCAIMGCGTAAVVRHFGWTPAELARHPFERSIAFAVPWELTEREREVARLAYGAGRESEVASREAKAHKPNPPPTDPTRPLPHRRTDNKPCDCDHCTAYRANLAEDRHA